ncbi:hypothetical protein HK096_009365 [Nowakowskiella sp. JEL0078]|nr:hypothetical protein HK096_009365 [Nowakowskiella sp. JEL0078]
MRRNEELENLVVGLKIELNQANYTTNALNVYIDQIRIAFDHQARENLNDKARLKQCEETSTFLQSKLRKAEKRITTLTKDKTCLAHQNRLYIGALEKDVRNLMKSTNEMENSLKINSEGMKKAFEVNFENLQKLNNKVTFLEDNNTVLNESLAKASSVANNNFVALSWTLDKVAKVTAELDVAKTAINELEGRNQKLQRLVDDKLQIHPSETTSPEYVQTREIDEEILPETFARKTHGINQNTFDIKISSINSLQSQISKPKPTESFAETTREIFKRVSFEMFQ